MMRHLGIEMKVTCEKKSILETLRNNRENHAQLVAEARKGYVEKAQEELQRKLMLLQAGKVTALSFHLKVPVDFTTVYDTTIRMLEQHTGDTIELRADEFRHLVEDEWEWTRDFVLSNTAYSPGTQRWGVSKGFDVE